MQLSEAIRLGATMGPQITRRFREGDATCALGAAYLATGLMDELYMYSMMELTALMSRRFPIFVADPNLMNIIVDLNDRDSRTREQIADYVEQRELELGFLTVKEEEARIEESALVEA